ncbi:hypothetical protein AX769_21245 (plasmid) [Frondihabitans sp. PAMC 28766]|nr:hypothetical protein AX769_21245 [Frondihabitans sp. PAMC 28766]
MTRDFSVRYCTTVPGDSGQVLVASRTAGSAVSPSMYPASHRCSWRISLAYARLVFSEIDASASSAAAAASSGRDRYAWIALPRLTRLAATAFDAPAGPAVLACVVLPMRRFLPLGTPGTIL